MRLVHQLMTAIVMLNALHAAAQPSPPRQARIEYVERSTGLPAVMNWQADAAGQYSLSLRIPVVFLTIEYRSTGAIDASQGLKPNQFIELRNDQPKRRAMFDWQAGLLRYNDERDSAPLPAEASALVTDLQHIFATGRDDTWSHLAATLATRTTLLLGYTEDFSEQLR